MSRFPFAAVAAAAFSLAVASGQAADLSGTHASPPASNSFSFDVTPGPAATPPNAGESASPTGNPLAFAGPLSRGQAYAQGIAPNTGESASPAGNPFAFAGPLSRGQAFALGIAPNTGNSASAEGGPGTGPWHSPNTALAMRNPARG
jgi:hypothetical protein